MTQNLNPCREILRMSGDLTILGMRPAFRAPMPPPDGAGRLLQVCSNPQFKFFGRNELDLFLIDLAGTTLGHIEP